MTDGRGAWFETEGRVVWVGLDEVIITVVPHENELPTREHNKCVQRMPVSYEQHIVEEDIKDKKKKKKTLRGFVVRKATDPLQRILPCFQACVRWLLERNVCTRIDCDDASNKEKRNTSAREARAQVVANVTSVLFGTGFDVEVVLGKSSQVLHCYTTVDVVEFERSLQEAVSDTTEVKGLVEHQERAQDVNEDEEWWNAMLGAESDDACIDTKPDKNGNGEHDSRAGENYRSVLENPTRTHSATSGIKAIQQRIQPVKKPGPAAHSQKPAAKVCPTISRAAQMQLPEWRRQGPASSAPSAATTHGRPQAAGQQILNQVRNSAPSKENPWKVRAMERELEQSAGSDRDGSAMEDQRKTTLEPEQWDPKDPWKPPTRSGAERPHEARDAQGWKPQLRIDEWNGGSATRYDGSHATDGGACVRSPGQNGYAGDSWHPAGKSATREEYSGKHANSWRLGGKGNAHEEYSGKHAKPWRPAGKGVAHEDYSGKHANSWRPSGKGNAHEKDDESHADSWQPGGKGVTHKEYSENHTNSWRLGGKGNAHEEDDRSHANSWQPRGKGSPPEEYAEGYSYWQNDPNHGALDEEYSRDQANSGQNSYYSWWGRNQAGWSSGRRRKRKS